MLSRDKKRGGRWIENIQTESKSKSKEKKSELFFRELG